jgi:RND family efflux transporter MFP subunit
MKRKNYSAGIKFNCMVHCFNQKLHISIVLLVLAMMAFSCKNDKDKKIEQVASATTIHNTEAFILSKSNLTSSVKIPGELVAYQQVDLYAKVNSFIKKLHVDVGSEVNEGQLLAELDAPEINAQLSGAESKLKSQEAIYLASKATYDRLYETSKTPGTISKNDLDLANAKQKSDLAQLEAAKSAYREITDTKSYLQIRAPFNGVITGRNVSAGAYVGPSGKGSEMPIFTLQEHKKLRLVVSIPETYTSYLSDKNEVDFTVNSIISEKFKAKISRLAGALDTKLRSQHIEMDVINNDKKLLPGMVAEVSIPLNSNTSAFAVPASAVLNATTGVFVITVQGKKIVWVPVKTGRTDDGRTEVFGTLTQGDTIITHAGEEMRNGSMLNNYSIK